MKPIERSLWIVITVAILGWGLSRQTSPPAAAGRTGELTADEPGNRSNLSSDNSAPRREKTGARSAGTRGGVESKSLAALRSKDPLVRMAEFLKMLESSDAASFDQISAALNQLQAEGISLPAEEALMDFRAGQLRGEKIFATLSSPPRDPADAARLEKQYAGWAEASPQAASRWLDSLPAGKFHDKMAVQYIAACAGNDPARSLDLVASLHPSQQAAAGALAGKRLAESSTAEEASAALASLSSQASEEDTPYLRALFDSLAQNPGNSAMAAALAEQHSDQSYVSSAALARISAGKAKEDPVDALRWAAGMEGMKSDVPPGGIQEAAIQGMTLDGLSKAEKWLSSQHDDSGSFLQQVIEKRRQTLEEHGDESNEYDKDD